MSNHEQEALSSNKIIKELKEYLDQGFKIRVDDLVMGEARVLFDQLAAEFSDTAQTPFSPEELIKRLKHYEAITKPLQNLMIAGCYWGEKKHERVWAKCLELIANPPREAGLDIWVELRLYPALLLLYSGGIAAIAGEQYSNFYALLVKARLLEEIKDEPLVLGLNIPKVMETNVGRTLPGMDNRRTPLSDYLYVLLREPFKEFLPQDFRYQRSFDRF